MTLTPNPLRTAAWAMLWAALLVLASGGAARPCAAEADSLQPGIEGLSSDQEKRRFEAALSLVTDKHPETVGRLRKALEGEPFRRSPLSAAAAEFVVWKLSGKPSPGKPSRGVDRPHIILISVDTLRADHLGCYGNRRGPSPTIDALATEGAQFMNAMSPSSWTLPAHMSMFTSLYPSFHKVESSNVKLDASVPTLSETLKAQAYTTVGFVTHSFLASEWGFARGFDRYEMHEADAAGQTQRAIFWLDWHRFHAERGLASPSFFLFVHYIDPHETYAPPPQYRERYAPVYAGPLTPSDHLVTLYREKEFERPEDFQYTLALYDGEIAFVDDQLRLLLEKLRTMGLEERTVVIVTADHGEEFKDHGSMGHKHTLYDEQLRVPLIIRYPSGIRANQRVFPQVSLVDLYPTVLHLVGLEPPAGIQGTSVLGYLELKGPLERSASVREEPVFAELGPLGSSWERNFRRRVIRTERHKLIFNYLDDGSLEKELYLLETDPGEQTNVYPSRGLNPEVRQLETRLKAFIQHGLSSNSGFRERNPVDRTKARDEVLERLRSLGYLEPGGK